MQTETQDPRSIYGPRRPFTLLLATDQLKELRKRSREQRRSITNYITALIEKDLLESR